MSMGMHLTPLPASLLLPGCALLTPLNPSPPLPEVRMESALLRPSTSSTRAGYAPTSTGYAPTSTHMHRPHPSAHAQHDMPPLRGQPLHCCHALTASLITTLSAPLFRVDSKAVCSSPSALLLLSLPSAVSSFCCLFLLLSLPSAVSSFCCLFLLLSLPSAVSSFCCLFLLLSLPSAVSSFCCLFLLLSLPSAVSSFCWPPLLHLSPLSAPDSSELPVLDARSQHTLTLLTGSPHGRIDFMLQDPSFQHQYLQAMSCHFAILPSTRFSSAVARVSAPGSLLIAICHSPLPSHLSSLSSSPPLLPLSDAWIDKDIALLVIRHLYRHVPRQPPPARQPPPLHAHFDPSSPAPSPTATTPPTDPSFLSPPPSPSRHAVFSSLSALSTPRCLSGDLSYSIPSFLPSHPSSSPLAATRPFSPLSAPPTPHPLPPASFPASAPPAAPINAATTSSTAPNPSATHSNMPSGPPPLSQVRGHQRSGSSSSLLGRLCDAVSPLEHAAAAERHAGRHTGKVVPGAGAAAASAAVGGDGSGGLQQRQRRQWREGSVGHGRRAWGGEESQGRVSKVGAVRRCVRRVQAHIEEGEDEGEDEGEEDEEEVAFTFSSWRAAQLLRVQLLL
ncbi:unnamed protein product [Closterium sp. NIES-65]|nr:unnamed protein product [Closterium sp. NIES-65]